MSEFEDLAAKCLAGESSPAERGQLEAALKADAELRAEYEDLKVVWRVLGDVGPLACDQPGEPVATPEHRLAEVLSAVRKGRPAAGSPWPLPIVLFQRWIRARTVRVAAGLVFLAAIAVGSGLLLKWAGKARSKDRFFSQPLALRGPGGTNDVLAQGAAEARPTLTNGDSRVTQAPMHEAEPVTLEIVLSGAATPKEREDLSKSTLVLETRAGEPHRTAPIDAQGKARFEMLPPALLRTNVALRLKSEGWQWKGQDAERLTVLVSGQPLELAVERRGRRVRGTVLDSDEGKPLEGARVAVSGLSTNTDANGAFEIFVPRVPPGASFNVTAAKEGWTTFRRTMEQITGPLDIRLRRPEPFTLALRLLTLEGGAPGADLPGAVLELQVGSSSWKATIGEGGEARFPGLPHALLGQTGLVSFVRGGWRVRPGEERLLISDSGAPLHLEPIPGNNPLTPNPAVPEVAGVSPEVPRPSAARATQLPGPQTNGSGAVAASFSEVPPATPPWKPPVPAEPGLFSGVPPPTPAYNTPLPPLERMVAEAKASELEKRLEAEHAQAEKDRQAQAKANVERERRAEAKAKAQKGPQAFAKAQPEKAPQTAAKAQVEKDRQAAAKAKAEKDLQTAAQAQAANDQGRKQAERAALVIAKTRADEAKAKPNTPPGAETRPLAMTGKGALASPSPQPPPLPISIAKQQRLAELLRKYKADEITPAQYHQERARILAEPEIPARTNAKP